MIVTKFRSIQWSPSGLHVLNQQLLPHRTEYVLLTNYEAVIDAIKNMTVRGAPAIAIAAAYGVCLAARSLSNKPKEFRNAALAEAIAALGAARPTAVNLSWAMNIMQTRLEGLLDATGSEQYHCLLDLAHSLFCSDIETNKAIAHHALPLFPQHCSVIHHCNTGSLATADYGTALGTIRYAHESGKQVHAYLDETRPRFQGASLSAYELNALGIPHTVVVDSASGLLMQRRGIDLCIVGCDRVTARGDVVNKIGTYNLAIVARAHKTPFYVACPFSSIDQTIQWGSDVAIEERSPDEITTANGREITPPGTHVFNPAFDVTPAEYVSAFITEKGIIYPGPDGTFTLGQV